MADWEVVVWQDMREVLAMRFDNRDDATSMRSTLFHMYGADNPNVRISMHYASRHPLYCIFRDAMLVNQGVITERYKGRPMPFVYATADPGVAEALPPMDPAPARLIKKYFDNNVAVLTWKSQYGIEVSPLGKYDLRDRIGDEWRSIETEWKMFGIERHEWDVNNDGDFLTAQLDRRIRKQGRR
jgi:hypothetical protein